MPEPVDRGLIKLLKRCLFSPSESDIHAPLDRFRSYFTPIKQVCSSPHTMAVIMIARNNKQKISKADNRRRIIEAGRWLVDDCGFDGVQWDYEFCPNGDKDFLTLLEETREEFKGIHPDKLISVATPMWYPGTLWGFDDDYFKEVAKRCDQIAVMCYDSFFYYPRAYVWLIKEQAIRVPRLVHAVNPEARVLLGIPVYDGGTLGHISHTENIKLALLGINEGLAHKQACREAFEGVAPFAEYTMDEGEWKQYRIWWLGKD